jgi:hypothetical protein
MLHNFQHCRRCIIILTLITLSLGFGGKVTLCFTPDGDMHIKQNPSSCYIAGSCHATADTLALNHKWIKKQGHCLDVFLGGDVSDHHSRYIVKLPFPIIAPLRPPSSLALTDKKTFYTTRAITPPQLLSLRSVILLI